MQFLAGEDVVLDRQLIAFDIEASKAHVMGLAKIGLLTADEAHSLQDGLERGAPDALRDAVAPRESIAKTSKTRCREIAPSARTRAAR